MTTQSPGGPRTTYEDRERIIECAENGEDFDALAATLNVNRCTAYAIVRNHHRQKKETMVLITEQLGVLNVYRREEVGP